MAWYANNITATRFGATRYCLDQTPTAATATLASIQWNAPYFTGASVSLYTCTSTGALTLRASGSYVHTDDFAFRNDAIAFGNLASAIPIPAGGGVALTLAATGDHVSQSQTFYSPPLVGQLNAGVYSANVYESGVDDSDNFQDLGYVMFGNGTSYIPDALITLTSSHKHCVLMFGAGF